MIREAVIVQVLFTFCYWLKWDATVPLDFTATVFKFFYIITCQRLHSVSGHYWYFYKVSAFPQKTPPIVPGSWLRVAHKEL